MVAIIVVTFNRLELLKECISSLRNQSYKDRAIIVVNNGSTDGTKQWLEQQNDLIIINQDNIGGAGGFYSGIKYACEQGYEYSWIMDDDVEARDDTLEKLMKVTTGSIGFLCSRVLDVNGTHSNVPRITKKTSNQTGEWIWGNLLDRKMIGVDVTSFVSVLIPNRIVYELGLPYKEYFIWGDDTEYTSRISDKYLSYMVIDSVILHKRKIASELSIFTEQNANRVKFYYFSYRNRIHGSKNLIKKAALFVLGTRDSLRLLMKGNVKKANIAFRGSLSGLFFRPKIKYPEKK